MKHTHLTLHALLRVLLVWYGLAHLAHAQTFVVSQPDCVIFFHFTATGQTSPTSPNAGFDNRTTGCTTWSVSLTSVTLTNATVTLQSAPNTSTGVPGTWVTFANGSALQNVNPITISGTPAAGFFSLVGYNPWVRVLLTVSGGPATGVVDGAAFGWRIPSAGTASISTPSQNVNIQQVAGTPTVTGGVAGLLGVGGAAADGANAAGNPVLIGGHDTAVPSKAHIIQTDTFGDVVLAGVSAAQSDGSSNTPTIPGLGTSGSPVPSTNRGFNYKFNGATWDRDFVCNLTAEVALSGTGYTQIVAGSGSTVIRVCKVFVTSSSAGAPVVNTFTAAVGVCASTPTELFNAAGVTGLDSDYFGALRSNTGGAFCVKESVANSDKVTVTYVQY